MCELFPALRANGLLDKFIGVMATGQPMIEERESVLKNGRCYHLQAVRLGDGIGLTVRDITEAKQEADRIRHQALHDPLTGLANRAGFEAALTEEVIAASAKGRVSALALIDLDDFKQVNDTLGHAAGDLLLKEVAQRLRDSLRPSDVVARLGGDEFVLILSNVGYRVGAEKLARKLVAAVARPMILGGHEARVSASMGVTLFPYADDAPADLLRQADEAMYEAKNAGRNGYVIFDRTVPKP
jgi:diguanylate cyclase (GGDEF)-like protein